MNSKYTQAFDSLSSDDEVKRKRTERILYAESVDEDEIIAQPDGSAVKAKKRLSGKRGVAIITAVAILFAAIAISVPVIVKKSCGGLLNAMSLLKNTFVDMNGVAAFGVWNAPDSSSSSAYVSDVAYVNFASDASESQSEKSDDDIITGDWSDEDRYDWESDYDWDPTKANVLIAINEDGKINEVVYERTNGRGQVRQDVLGNAAAVYVSNGFTFVMYVDDDEWNFWKDINFAQYMRSPNGFSCHHERTQTVVIHNATGKVFALKDVIPQVNELSGATNYTMHAYPFKDDFILIQPMYGNLIPQWYTLLYDEQSETIIYELMLPKDCEALNSYYWGYYVRAARRDKYGQQYLLESNAVPFDSPRVSAGIVGMPSYTRYGNTITFSTPNGFMMGTDGRVYAFEQNKSSFKLKVFGENFELSDVEPNTKVAFEGIASEFFNGCRDGDGISYKLAGGYLYSMFGEIWKLNDDGSLGAQDRLLGSFPKYADDGYLIGGEIIAFVDTEQTNDKYAYSINGRIVQIDFVENDGVIRSDIRHIIDASEMSVGINNRMTVEQNENPISPTRGDTKYFLISVENGKAYADYFAYGYDGGIVGLTRPITEPVKLN